MTRKLTIFFIVFLLGAPATFAEVCALFNSSGRFVKLDVLTDSVKGVVWGKLSKRPDYLCLNLTGDGPTSVSDPLPDGDPAETVVAMPDEDPDLVTSFVDPFAWAPAPSKARGRSEALNNLKTPVVVWSRHDGNDWELVYSFWDYNLDAWAPVRFVETIDNGDDDIAPQLNRSNRKHVILQWSRLSGAQEFLGATGEMISTSTGYDVLWSDPTRNLKPIQTPKARKSDF